MHVLISEYGVKIEVENACFLISNKETKKLLSPIKINSINILKHCNITTAALILAAQNQIPVLIYNGIGQVEAWLWSPHYGNIASLRKKQAIYTIQNKSLQWIKQLLLSKAQKQLANIKWLINRMRNKQADNPIANIEQEINNFEKTELTKTALRAAEGKIAALYWQGIATLTPQFLLFNKREKRGALHPINIAINYAYGILYGMVEASLLMAGLDPNMGILHIDRYNRPALAFDHIEPFRPWIDRMVLELFLSKQLDEKHFIQTKLKGTIIEKEGKKILINQYFATMNEKALLNGKRIKRHDHIHYQSSLLVKEIKKTAL